MPEWYVFLGENDYTKFVDTEEDGELDLQRFFFAEKRNPFSIRMGLGQS